MHNQKCYEPACFSARPRNCPNMTSSPLATQPKMFPKIRRGHTHTHTHTYECQLLNITEYLNEIDIKSVNPSKKRYPRDRASACTILLYGSSVVAEAPLAWFGTNPKPTLCDSTTPMLHFRVSRIYRFQRKLHVRPISSAIQHRRRGNDTHKSSDKETRYTKLNLS